MPVWVAILLGLYVTGVMFFSMIFSDPEAPANKAWKYSGFVVALFWFPFLVWALWDVIVLPKTPPKAKP